MLISCYLSDTVLKKESVAFFIKMVDRPRFNRFQTLAAVGALALSGLGDANPTQGHEDSSTNPQSTATTQGNRIESGKHWLRFRKGDPVLAGTVVTDGVNRKNWRYNCYFPNVPRDGALRYGVINYSRADLKAAKDRGAKQCRNVDPRPGPRRETGNGSLTVERRDFAYGYYFVDGDDGEIRYNVKVNGGEHPKGTIFYGVRNYPAGEPNRAGNFINYDNANPRTGPRQETGAGGVLTFGPGAEVYGWNIMLEDGRECNPLDQDGTRTGPGCELVNAPMSGEVESGVVDPPPQELKEVELPSWQP